MWLFVFDNRKKEKSKEKNKSCIKSHKAKDVKGVDNAVFHPNIVRTVVAQVCQSCSSAVAATPGAVVAAVVAVVWEQQ